MLRLDELEVYQRAMEIGEKAWKIVASWDFFTRDSLGKQFVKAADKYYSESQ